MSALFVSNMEKSVRFYKDIMHVPFEWDGGCFAAEDYLILCARSSMEGDGCLQPLTYPSQNNGTMIMCYGVNSKTDVDHYYQTFKSAGVSSICSPKENQNGFRFCCFEDPDKNIIMITEADSSDLGDLADGEMKYLYDILPVKDVERMRDFYRNIAGFKVEMVQESYRLYALDGMIKGVFVNVNELDSSIRASLSFPGGINGTMEICMPVAHPDDVDTRYEKALAFGSSAIYPPNTAPWGLRNCFVTDPENNLLEFVAEV